MGSLTKASLGSCSDAAGGEIIGDNGDLRRSPEVGRLDARELANVPQMLSKLVHGARTASEACVATCSRLQTMIDADQTHLNAIFGSVRQGARSGVIVVVMARLGKGQAGRSPADMSHAPVIEPWHIPCQLIGAGGLQLLPSA